MAPMMDWSDRHCRHFVRLLAPRTLLYTEMVVAEAVVRGRRERLLGYDPSEHPLALQLGGSDPAMLALAARIGADHGYDEINLNVGCPSERVQNATFGACLMARPSLVAECVAAMRARVAVPVTVKCRIGIDDDDHYEFLLGFVDAVAAAGCDTFIVHARKAVLSGLSPRENREIPPLRYELVWRLKAERPALTIVVNGGLTTIEAVERQWQRVDGAMIGREAYHHPYFLAELDRRAWPEGAVEPPPPAALVAALRPYVESQLAAGERLHAIARHLLGLYAYRPGARAFRRVISELAPRAGAGYAVLEAAVRAAEGAEALRAAG
ncbi:MAG: tRNA dihydrouridine(20/20a) synthase DusA [Proteobacteria bacterium]|nr:tRNA dihydrouridine(20/20a) synthase DusA [Pseudomonadota bacterium]